MNDGGLGAKMYRWSWRSHDRHRVVHATIIHVAAADMDAPYGAYVAVENLTFNNTNYSNPQMRIKKENVCLSVSWGYR